MKRQIINIDKEKCNGCGLCVSACKEGAIGLVDGKAELLRDDYCDGLGNCLPVCPTGAITFEEREAGVYNKQEAEKHMPRPAEQFHGCPGSQSKTMKHAEIVEEETGITGKSQLGQWPVQIKLAPVRAPFYQNANLLIAADCTAYACGDFHNRFMKNRVTLIGCPKLDEGDYSEKLTEIIRENDIKSVTIVRMEVPCCGGMARAAETALRNSGKFIPWNVVTLTTDGQILEG